MFLPLVPGILTYRCASRDASSSFEQKLHDLDISALGSDR